MTPSPLTSRGGSLSTLETSTNILTRTLLVVAVFYFQVKTPFGQIPLMIGSAHVLTVALCLRPWPLLVMSQL